ncbi:MAG TPA: hypothetical protein VFY22_01125, partial [Hydrogenophaga sp.]|nr:hypothetical protein [Hydrogenophaga sp.]
MEDSDLLSAQRALRRQFFEGEAAVRWRPARELAAQLILYLDDPQMCWQLATDWIRAKLDADRADGGFGGYLTGGGAKDYVAIAESQRSSIGLPAVLGHHFDAREPSIRHAWCNAGLTPVIDVSQEVTMTPIARNTLQTMGTFAKLALPVSDGDRPVGLICADWNRVAPRWHADTCNELNFLARGVLGPVLGAAMDLAPARKLSAAARDGDGMERLTPAELRVARLVAQGLN